jgi:hypothetical protein
MNAVEKKSIAADKKYREDLLLALRLHDISGVRVGDVLAEVEAHVAETGEDPTAAFGTPKEYAAKVAAQLDAESGKPSTLQNVTGALTTGALVYVGLGLLVDGLRADGSTVPVTMAYLASGIIFIGLLTLEVFLFFRAATAVTKGRLYGVLGACVFVGSVAVLIFSDTLFDDETALIEISRWVAVGLGLAALTGSVLVLLRAIRRGRIVDPR